jgi:RHS repeat-associated protein
VNNRVRHWVLSFGADGYQLGGSLKTLTYPSVAVVTYTPDSAGRDLSAVDNGNGVNYVTSATYDATSALTGFVSGYTGGFAGITNTFIFNKRLQPVFMSASAPSQTVFSIGYDFHAGNGTAGSGSDNGNVYSLLNYRDHTRDQTFTYDALNRLISAQNAGTDCTVKLVNGNLKFWGNIYTYDAWGNLSNKSKISTACSGEALNVTAGTNNQLYGYGYDAAGNMTHDATSGWNYTYDQESRITGAAGYTYTYDADGNRVEKSNGSTGTLYWYMTPGIVAESDLTGNLQSEYVFFDGERVARKDFPSNAVSYYFSDHLKTTDIVTDAQGNIKNESDFYPWGGELPFVANDSNRYKFTGKERDSETGLDYFGARYYSNGLGRFVTPDWSTTPVPVPYADLTDPQTLNLYGYVRGLPTTKADLDGHGWWTKLGNSFKEDGCWCEDQDYAKSHAAGEKRRQEAAAREQWEMVDSPWAKQWAKDHGGVSPRDALIMGALATAGVQMAYGYGPQPNMSAPVEGEEPVEVTISRSKSPAAAQHIDDAQAAGQPDVVTLDRSGTQGAARAAARGRAATRGLPTNSITDNDEYPPKCCAEGGAGSSVRPIPRSDNRSGGGQLSSQTRTLPDGTKVKIKTGP